MDRDGIAAEVIFHGSQNFEPIPFLPQLLGNDANFEFDRDLAAVGVRIYNDWLADACSVEPARHVGLAHLPMWDPDAATAELPRVADSGLRGVNFPAMRHGVYLEYNNHTWDPFWAESANPAWPCAPTSAPPARRRRRGPSRSRSRRSRTAATSPGGRSGG